MNKVGFRHLAPLGALALALGLSAGTASACSTAAWTSVTGAPVAGGPLEGNGVIRYRGLCGLRTAAGGNSYVAVDHGTQESTYRARFYFFASASGTVMESYSDAGATTPVISVAYDSSAGTISATVPGSTGLSVSGIVPNRWYGVQVTRIVGQPAVLQVRGGGGTATSATINQSVTGTGNATGSGVRLTRLGAIGAAAGAITVDEFEASRGANPIALRCRGDANGSGGYEINDVIGVLGEVLFIQGDSTKSPSSGSPDYNEDGIVTINDVVGALNAILASQAGSPGAGCP